MSCWQALRCAAQVTVSQAPCTLSGQLAAMLAVKAKHAYAASLPKELDTAACCADSLRVTILRPNLIWSPERPAAVSPVAAFTIANALGAPGVDKPVRATTLAGAVASAVRSSAGCRTWRFADMEREAKHAGVHVPAW